MNKKKNIKDVNNKKRGFTLIELLATITIIAIVSVIVVYTATNVIGKAKTKTYKVSISNIEQKSGTYATENQSSLKWIPVESDHTSEYYCVTVKDLIDSGYFDNQILKSKIDENRTIKQNDYIYLRRNITSKTIIENRLLTDVEAPEYCDDITSAGIISFKSVQTGWSAKKDIIINYQILNFNGNGRDYTYYYLRDDTGEVVQTEFTNSIKEIEVENFSGNSIVAKIYQGETELASKTFSPKIDAEEPTLEISVEDGDIFKKDNYAYLKLTDTKSGFRRGNYKVYYEWSQTPLTCNQIKEANKSVELYVSEDNLKESESYGVYISNYSGIGKVYACADESVTDYSGNNVTNIPKATMKLDNDRPTIAIGNYTPTTNVRGSVTVKLIITEPTSSIDYNSFDKNDIEIKIGSTPLSTEKIDLTKTNEDKTETEYSLIIKNTEYDGQVTIKIADNKVYDIVGNGNEYFEEPLDIIFKNTYMINYNKNGGTGSMNQTKCYYARECTLSENSFTYTGHTHINWNTESNGSGTAYTNKVSGYNSDEDLTLYAQWQLNKYTISYNSCGGSSAPSSQTKTHGTDLTLTNSTPTKDYYKFSGWNTTGCNKTEVNYTSGATYSQEESKTLYAVWKANTVTIKYHVNGGSIATSSNTNGTWTAKDSIVYRNGEPHILKITYGNKHDLTNYNNPDWLNISRTDYIAKTEAEWICLSGCSTSEKTFNQTTEYATTEFCNVAAGDCTVTLGVNWEEVPKDPPTCTLSASGETITAKVTDNSGKGIAYKGWSSSYSGDTSTKTEINEAKKYTYYVKDNAGLTNKCSIDIKNKVVSKVECDSGYTTNWANATCSKTLNAYATKGRCSLYPPGGDTTNETNKTYQCDNVTESYCYSSCYSTLTGYTRKWTGTSGWQCNGQASSKGATCTETKNAKITYACPEGYSAISNSTYCKK